jgi:hypothetical protein
MMQKKSTPPEISEAPENQVSRMTVMRKILPVTLIALAVILFFKRMIFSDLILARGDTFLYFYPYWQAAADAISSGRLPLWNNLLFMGAPFLANSQIGLLYPLNWPFWLTMSVPQAVSGSIILHVFIAGIGTFLAARRCLSLSKSAALLSAILFALGGYLTAQVEHINQLQGLAWLPWYFVAACSWKFSLADRRATIRFVVTIAILMSLQLLAGHIQTLFITIVGLVVWLLSTYYQIRAWQGKKALKVLLILLGAAILALLLSGTQIVPTFELMLNSSRQGGLSPREALSFSLHPLLLARALLPQYDTSLFSEYVAFLPLSALLLSILGVWSWRRDPQIRAAFFVALVGFFFALGLFNPIYQLLVRLPGFDLFRVPARWLALYAIGVALLAGAGLDELLSRSRQRPIKKPLLFGFTLLIALMGWGLISVTLSSYVKLGSEVSAEYPGLLTWVGWGVELVAAALLIYLIINRNGRWLTITLVLLVVVFLFATSRGLPYNNLTTAEAYTDLRPPISRLQAIATCQKDELECDPAGGRILSLSDIIFDPGDQAEIDTIYGELLPESDLYDYTIAIKQKEIIVPDLSMTYGLQSVDGFDGGILPLANYPKLMDLVLPEGETATDGRLREYLGSVPDERWLDLFGAKYLITDKVADEWMEGVFFDKQHPAVLDEGNLTISSGFLPEFEATELWLISNDPTGTIEISSKEGDSWRLALDSMAGRLYRAPFLEPIVLDSLTLAACDSTSVENPGCENEWRVDGISLVDSRDGTFMPIVLGQYKLIHSGDVKIYENLDVQPRVFLVSEWVNQPDVEASVSFMDNPRFDPAKEAVIIGPGGDLTLSGSGYTALVEKYDQEYVSLSMNSDDGGLLILADAFYPGWKATIDGRGTPIYQVDGYFRGVLVPGGQHQIEFEYEPESLKIGMALTLLGLIVLAVLFGFMTFRRVK